MSTLTKFVQKALKNPTEVETTVSQNDYLNYQTQKAIDPIIKQEKKASRFLKMGMMAAIIAGPALALAHGDHSISTGKYQSEANETIKLAQIKGYLKVAPELTIKEITSQDRQYDLNTKGADNIQKITTTASQCDITISFTKDGYTAFLGNGLDLKQQTTADNDNQKKLYRDFILLHELSHCELNTLKDIFIIKGNPQLQKDVNYYFKDMAGTRQSDSAYSMLHENFADTYAAVQLIKLYGDTPDVLKVLNKVTLEREDTDVQTSQFKVDSHYSHFSMEEILKKETIEKIKAASTEDLRTIALDIANKGTNTVLSTFSDNLPSMFEERAMIFSTAMNFYTASDKDYYKQDIKKLGATGASYFQQLGLETYQKNGRITKGDKATITDAEAVKVLAISENSFTQKFNSDSEKIQKTSSEFIKYITSFKPVLAQKTEYGMDDEDLAKMKKDYVQKYQYRDTLIDNNFKEVATFDSSSVLKNIANMRKEQQSTHTSTLKIK